MHRLASVYAVVSAWAQNGLFAVLEQGPCNLKDLPGDDRALGTTARILGHLGLLVGSGDRWGLSLTGLALFRDGALGMTGVTQRYKDWSKLGEVLSLGGPVRNDDGTSRVSEGGVREHDKADTRRFMDMLYRRSEHSAPQTVEWMQPHLSPNAHVLDVGGGHGRYAECLVDAGFQATVFDKSVCIDLARQRYGDRLKYVSGDFFVDDFSGEYDGALLSNIVHGLGADEIVSLLKKLHQVIAPGGLLVIKDMFLDETRVQPEPAVVFALTMLMYTRQGDSYDRAQFDGFLKSAGFERIAMIDVTDQRFSLLLARRQ